MMHKRPALVALMAMAALSAWATGSKQTMSRATDKQSVPAALKVPLLGEGLRLSDFSGMTPNPELKDKLLHVSGFIQNSPSDGKAATEDTEVWMGYTKNALYMVFICHDRHAEQIRGHLARRENILKDDYVTVLLDTFKDRRTGVLFSVNPAGVQADASWNETSGTDFSYDQVWDSEGRVTAQGWMALVSIPFRSLRFRGGGADWGVVFWRNFPRNSEVDYWPRVSANISGVLSQEAALASINGVTGSHNVQANPYVLGQNERTLDTIDPLNPFFSARRAEGTGGGEFKAVLKDKTVLDATINPDFSDVESDQPQFTVNQRYPVYFPELRPFFLENASFFSTPINLVYTRNIVHPEYGVRTTGKLGRVNLGLFAIDDREPGDAVAAGDPLYKKRAKIAVGRTSVDLGKGSSVGAIYADEEFGGGWNRIGGVDFKARMGDHWTGLGQWVESSTKGTVDSGTPPTYEAGPASYLEFQRSGHAFNLDSVFNDFSTNFQTQLGFIQTSDIRSDQTHATYQWFPKHSKIQSYGLETNQNLAFDHQGNRVYRYMTFDPFWLLPRNTVLAPLVGENSDTVGPQDGYNMASNRNFSENFGGFVARGAPFTQLNFNVIAIRSGNVNYNPASGLTPFLMNEESVNALFTVQPLRQLTDDNTYLLDRNHAVASGALVYEVQTFRSKINYQFTRAISARVIVEYDTTLANPALTSLSRTKQVGTQALVTWLPHPGTAIYIGYNNDMQNLDRTLCNRLPGGACDPNNTTAPRAPMMLDDGKQIFIKASYLFRF
jgi:hypothetical protein